MSEFTNLNVLQVGVGGTGSYLVPPLTRFLNSLIRSLSYKASYYLVDGDIVEEKNTLRQNFSNDHIGTAKCSVFTDPIIQSFPMMLEKSTYNLLINKLIPRIKDPTLNVVIGCVDTIEARMNIVEMLELMYKKDTNNVSTFYVDSGNFISTGQALVFDYQKDSATNIKEKVHKIFEEDKDAVQMDSAPSCTDNGDQSIAANFQAASLVYNIVTEILVNRTTSIKKISFMRYSRDIDYNLAEQLARGCV